jgi:hypothetical protein
MALWRKAPVTRESTESLQTTEKYERNCNDTRN